MFQKGRTGESGSTEREIQSERTGHTSEINLTKKADQFTIRQQHIVISVFLESRKDNVAVTHGIDVVLQWTEAA